MLLDALMRSLARMPGVEVRAACTVDEAVARGLDWSPDLVITDVDLNDPEGDGLDVACWLKGMTRVVVMSGRLDDTRRALAAKLGVEEVWQKPDVLGPLRRLLGVGR